MYRVAALVELAASAAALARHITKRRRLDPARIVPHVTNDVDVYAVLGRGRWLPTMCSHTPVAAVGPVELAALAAQIIPPMREPEPERTRTAGGRPVGGKAARKPGGGDGRSRQTMRRKPAAPSGSPSGGGR